MLTMNSVKILHAVRSAITATAELLVFFVLMHCLRHNNSISRKHACFSHLFSVNCNVLIISLHVCCLSAFSVNKTLAECGVMN